MKKERGAINEFVILCCRSEYTFLYAVDVLQRAELLLNSLAQGRYHSGTTQGNNDNRGIEKGIIGIIGITGKIGIIMIIGIIRIIGIIGK